MKSDNAPLEKYRFFRGWWWWCGGPASLPVCLSFFLCVCLFACLPVCVCPSVFHLSPSLSTFPPIPSSLWCTVSWASSPPPLAVIVNDPASPSAPSALSDDRLYLRAIDQTVPPCWWHPTAPGLAIASTAKGKATWISASLVSAFPILHWLFTGHIIATFVSYYNIFLLLCEYDMIFEMALGSQ